MRAYQDEFSKKVAMNHGLTRIGPGRRRLTRAEWHKEKQQAAFFADAKAQHKAARKNGYKVGLKQGEEKNKELGAIVGNFIAGALGSLHKPTAQALEQVEKAQQDSEKKKEKADKYAKESKEWADKRVADVSNQITLEKIKNKELEKEIKQKEKYLEDQADLLQFYQKKFGKEINNLPKNG
jgi:predicted RNase H-like nuclease (RuvC/YqgF family)